MATINLRNIPDRLKNQFKAICNLTNTTMTQAIIDYMSEIVHARTKEGMHMDMTGHNSNLLDMLLKRQPDQVLLKKLIEKENRKKDDGSKITPDVPIEESDR